MTTLSEMSIGWDPNPPAAPRKPSKRKRGKRGKTFGRKIARARRVVALKRWNVLAECLRAAGMTSEAQIVSNARSSLVAWITASRPAIKSRGGVTRSDPSTDSSSSSGP